MLNNCKYNLILNESVPKNSLKFNKWCSNNYKSPDFIPNLWAILFQISTACYVLQLTKTVHNDLHSGNIWIIKLLFNPVFRIISIIASSASLSELKE